jgi:hypothetical protein
MIEFIYHDGTKKEIAAVERRFPHLREGLTAFERLCEWQFNPTNPRQVIAPAKLHRLTQNNVWTMWKVELVVPKSGLRPNQYPRLWFAVKGAIIALLCLATHIDNYDDEKMNRLALSRVTDIF